MILQSWLSTANTSETDFPLQNLPYGVFETKEGSHIGVAIGDQILDLSVCGQTGLLGDLAQEIVAAAQTSTLNSLMALGPAHWAALRKWLMDSLSAGAPAICLSSRFHALQTRGCSTSAPFLSGKAISFTGAL